MVFRKYRIFSLSLEVAHTYNVISKIINYFVQNCKEYIKWPRNEEVEEIVAGFKAFQNIDGGLGAIEGSHIGIPKPQNHQHVSNSFILVCKI